MKSNVFQTVIWVLLVFLGIWVIIYNFFWESFKTALISETVVTLTNKSSLDQILTDVVTNPNGIFKFLKK
jgi:hypothetical protein